ncbi:hypothetical protein [Streptomyces sp. DH37]|uniref:hypothetical protein n=1 Tax=Streptomyces sp. DH37 TaxID=3040122 RepID=UPI00244164FA|nr:hypothetical protein [Streptomyces sp. DH37]MDG9703798.1 hypothetical protein [Streptomyces sp. DH37]
MDHEPAELLRVTAHYECADCGGRFSADYTDNGIPPQTRPHRTCTAASDDEQ